MAKKKKYVRKRHQMFVYVANRLVSPFIRSKTGFKVKRVKMKEYEPFIIISNHVSAFDPILVTGTLDRQVYYLSSELIFSKGLISRALEYTFAPIPKTKGQQDVAGIKTMMQVIKEGGNVGIFIEGNSTITGALSSVPPGVGKLVKLLKRPLLIFNFHGGYLSNPRWSIAKRDERYFTGFVREVLTYDDYKDMDPEVFQDYIIDKINVNAYDEPHDHTFPGKRNAEGLHRLLFMCPNCGAHNTLNATGNTLYCRSCTFTATYDEHGYLHSETFKEPQNTVVLDEKNKLAFQDYIVKHEDFTLTESGMFSEVFRRRRKHFGPATISLSREGLRVTYERKQHEDVFYPFDHIEGMVMQQKEVLVMYIKGEQTKMINIKNTSQTSAYQFVVALQILTNIHKAKINHEALTLLSATDMGLK